MQRTEAYLYFEEKSSKTGEGSGARAKSIMQMNEKISFLNLIFMRSYIILGMLIFYHKEKNLSRCLLINFVLYEQGK